MDKDSGLSTEDAKKEIRKSGTTIRNAIVSIETYKKRVPEYAIFWNKILYYLNEALEDIREEVMY